jgi:hypothetical protein
VHPVVSSCHLAIIGQPLLGAIELLLADDGGHRCDRDPLGRVRDPLGPLTASQRQQGGAAPLGGMRAEAIGKDLTEVDGIGEHASQGRGAPGPVTPGRRNAQPLQPLDQGEDRRTVVGEPSEQVTDDGGFGFVQPHPSRVAGPLGIKPVAIGRPRPGQEGSGAQLAQTTPAHALGNQSALILGHGAADLQQELVVRVAAHGPVQEHDLRPVLLQLLDQKHLMHVVARQPIWGRDQDPIQPGTRSGVTQAIEAGSSEASATIAVVAEDAIHGHAPALPLGMGAEAIELLVSGLGLGLALGRNPGVDGYLHGDSPPICLSEWRPRGRPDPRRALTEAAGKPGPTAARLPGG